MTQYKRMITPKQLVTKQGCLSIWSRC